MPIAQKVAHIFGPGGSLVQSGFEPRMGQRQMAALVAEAVDQGGWTAVEAPTGSGKSFAHLIPSILGILEARADADPGEKPPRLIVSTANLALQDQLVTKDIPTVARLLGVALKVAQLKSVSNYPCWLKVNEALGTIDYSGEQDEIMSLSEWMEDGGDLAKKDKDAVPFNLSPRIWPKVSTDREGCVGEKCPHYAPVPAEGSLLPTLPRCPFAAARQESDRAHILVTNHAYLARASKAFQRDGSLLVIDEGHALEDALRSAQVREIRAGHVKAIMVAAKAQLGNTYHRVTTPIELLLAEAEKVAPQYGRVALRPGWTKLDPSLFHPLGDLARDIEFSAEGEGDAFTKAKLERAAALVGSIADRCRAMLACDLDPDTWKATGPVAFWAERDDRGKGVLGFGMADVAPAMQALVQRFPKATLTSATLAPGGDLPGRLLASLGLTARRTAVLPSPFDLPKQGVLVVPRLPSVNDPEWSDAACDVIVQAVRESGGGALVLCSSMRMAKEAGVALRGAGLGVNIRVQGEAGRGELRAWFASDHDGVLVGSRSFYEGLDVQGDACRLVVIDRIPFEAPGDPLSDAAGDLAAQRIKSTPFGARSLPNAACALAQAAGRLIRSSTDRGAVVVLDGRVLAPSATGYTMRRALPPFPVSTDVADVGRHLRGQPLLTAVPAQPSQPSGPSMFRRRSV